MQTNFVSVKQLRENFQDLKTALEEGESFVLLYRSHPLARIRPFVQNKKTNTKTIKKNLNIVKKLAGGVKFGKKLTPSMINKFIDEQYEEEIDQMLY